MATLEEERRKGRDPGLALPPVSKSVGHILSFPTRESTWSHNGPRKELKNSPPTIRELSNRTVPHPSGHTIRGTKKRWECQG